MRSTRSILVVVTTVFAAWMCGHSDAAPSEAAAIRATRSFSDAALNGDLGRLERMLGTEFSFTQDGFALTRDAYLAPLREASPARMTSWTSSGVRAQVSGPLAAVTGRWSLAGVRRDTAFTHTLWFTCVWRVRDSTWMLIGLHTMTAS